MRLLESSSDLGYPIAQLELAIYYCKKRNALACLDLLLKAADQGMREAQFKAGFLLEKGFEGQKPDLNTALALYLKAAAQNSLQSILNLSFYYLTIENEEAQSLFWLTKANFLNEPLSRQYLSLFEKYDHLQNDKESENILEEKIWILTSKISNLFLEKPVDSPVIDVDEENQNIEEQSFNKLSIPDTINSSESVKLSDPLSLLRNFLFF